MLGRASATRRDVLAGTLGGVALLAGRSPSAVAAPVSTDKRPDVVHRGRAVAATHDGRFVAVARAGRPTLAIIDRKRGRRRTVQLPGHPVELAVSPNDWLLAVTTAFWDHPHVLLVHVRDAHRTARLDAGDDPFALAFTSDRSRLLVTGDGQDGTLRILHAPAFAGGLTVAVGRVPRGVAVGRGDRVAWVALHAEDAVVRVDLRTASVTARISVPPLPDRLAMSPDGRTLLVSHGGHLAHSVTDVDTRTGRVRSHDAGGVATAVAWTPAGRRLAALHREDAVSVIGGRRGLRLLPTVAAPRGLAVAGRRVFTVSAVTGAIGRVRP